MRRRLRRRRPRRRRSRRRRATTRRPRSICRRVPATERARTRGPALRIRRILRFPPRWRPRRRRRRVRRSSITKRSWRRLRRGAGRRRPPPRARTRGRFAKRRRRWWRVRWTPRRGRRIRRSDRSPPRRPGRRGRGRRSPLPRSTRTRWCRPRSSPCSGTPTGSASRPPVSSKRRGVETGTIGDVLEANDERADVSNVTKFIFQSSARRDGESETPRAASRPSPPRASPRHFSSPRARCVALPSSRSRSSRSRRDAPRTRSRRATAASFGVPRRLAEKLGGAVRGTGRVETPAPTADAAPASASARDDRARLDRRVLVESTLNPWIQPTTFLRVALLMCVAPPARVPAPARARASVLVPL